MGKAYRHILRLNWNTKALGYTKCRQSDINISLSELAGEWTIFSRAQLSPISLTCQGQRCKLVSPYHTYQFKY